MQPCLCGNASNAAAVNSIADYIGDTLVVGSFVLDKLA